MEDRASSAVLLRRVGAVIELRLNRPDTLNAIDDEVAHELFQGLAQVADDPGCRCLVLTGVGRGFCAGQSLGGSDAEERLLRDVGMLVRTRYNPLVEAIQGLTVPVLAAVNGVAAGAGLSLALAADLRVAVETASFSCAFGKLGLIPDSGASFFLPKYVGLSKALELAFTGQRLTAGEAAALGLVARIYPPTTFARDYLEFAQQLAEGPTRAFALTKRALIHAADATLSGQLALEADLQEEAAGTDDFLEGLSAFRLKRPARFVGR
jgi:2-(1,2-epoxy-1,2-dihydrophenyl)acetyl-CoA isomerase